MTQKQGTNSNVQIGIAAGLLVFSLVALIGIAFRVDPFVITQRAIGSGVATYFVVQLAILAVLLGNQR